MKNVAKKKEMMTAFHKIQLVWTITKKSFQTRTEFDAQLTEFKIEEHHEELVGTNILWAFILCFLNREPSHVTTLQKS